MAVTKIVHERCLMHKLIWETHAPLKTSFAKSSLYHHLCTIVVSGVSAVKMVPNLCQDDVAINSFGMGDVTIV